MGPKDTFASTWTFKTVFLLWLWVRAGSALLAAQEGRAQGAHPVLGSVQSRKQERGPAWCPKPVTRAAPRTLPGVVEGLLSLPPSLSACAVALWPGSEMQRLRCYRARGIDGFPLSTPVQTGGSMSGGSREQNLLCVWHGMFLTHSSFGNSDLFPDLFWKLL